MSLGTLALKNAVSSKGLSARFWHWARKALIHWGDDPVCQFPVHGKLLNINLSHELPMYQRRHPCYDTLPGRLAAFLRLHHPALIGVDVGANVGDSLAAFLGDGRGLGPASGNERFLAIEPNPKFFKILQSNWGTDTRVKSLAVLCSTTEAVAQMVVHEQRGTASIVPSAEGAGMQQRTIDGLVAEMPAFSACNLIKVDTDGHDFEVLAGAKKLIKSNLPTVLFECDVFGRVTYAQDIVKTFEMFAEAGYKEFLIYDNFGFLMGRSSLVDTQAFLQLVFYQLSSQFHYFDILLMADDKLSTFHANEVNYFSARFTDTALRDTAVYAAAGGKLAAATGYENNI